MKKIVFSAITVLALSSFATAGGDIIPVEPEVNIPSPVVNSWEGPYMGVFLGGTKGEVDVIDVDGYNGADFTNKADGLLATIYSGQNWQDGNFVYGLEGEFGYLEFSGSQQYPPYVGVRDPDDSLASVDSDFFVSVTGRLGYAFDTALLYVKGGIAGLNTDVSYIDNDPTGTTLVSGTSKSKFLWGPTIGGGLEFNLDSEWNIRAEYMYIDLDDISHTATSFGGTPFTFVHDIKHIHTFKLGVTYKF